METHSFMKAMSTSFDEMRTANELVDIVLVFGELRLPCHKVVLASTSQYFRRMFLAGLKESESDEVVMKDIDANTGMLVVKYLYSGKIEITEENAQDLLSASNMLLFTDLKDAIENFLCNHIQPPNCVSLLNLSHLFELQDLIKQSRQFINDEWDQLSDDSIIELKDEDLTEILTAHEFHEDNFIRLQRWVKSDEQRNKQFMYLLQHVELSRCSKTFINDTVMDEKLLQNPMGIKIIQQGLRDIFRCENRSETTIRHTIKNVSKLGWTRECSSELYTRNLLWQIQVNQTSQINEDKAKRMLGFYIECNSDSSESTTWSCTVNLELRLLNQTLDGKPFTRNSQTLFSPNTSTSCWGYKFFISWNELFDPENGYVKDDCIILEANIVEDVPPEV